MQGRIKLATNMIIYLAISNVGERAGARAQGVEELKLPLRELEGGVWRRRREAR